MKENEYVLTTKRKLFLEEWYVSNFSYVKDVEYLPAFNFTNLEVAYLKLIHAMPRGTFQRDLMTIGSKSEEEIISFLQTKYHQSRENIIKRIRDINEINNKQTHSITMKKR